MPGVRYRISPLSPPPFTFLLAYIPLDFALSLATYCYIDIMWITAFISCLKFIYSFNSFFFFFFFRILFLSLIYHLLLIFTWIYSLASCDYSFPSSSCFHAHQLRCPWHPRQNNATSLKLQRINVSKINYLTLIV